MFWYLIQFMSNQISIHDCRHLSDCFKDELISLFYTIDKDATGKTYKNSTVNMSKEMFNLPSDISDKNALKIFFEELNDIVVFAVNDESNELIGFTLLKLHDKTFCELIPQYTPLIAVNYSGVHPNYQGKGVWKNLREYVHDYIIPEYPKLEYIVTASSEENNVSKNANLSIGMKKVNSTNVVKGDEKTILFAKSIT